MLTGRGLGVGVGETGVAVAVGEGVAVKVGAGNGVSVACGCTVGSGVEVGSVLSISRAESKGARGAGAKSLASAESGILSALASADVPESNSQMPTAKLVARKMPKNVSGITPYFFNKRVAASFKFGLINGNLGEGV